MRADEAPAARLCPATMRPGPAGGRLDHDDGQDAQAAVTNSHGVSWRAPLRRAVLLLGGVALPVGWLLAVPAAGAPLPADDKAARTVTVADTAEAWFATSPVDICTTPLGCPPAQAPTSPYPADTLHVGVAGGQETARSYLLPDTSMLFEAASITSATMTLPIASGSTDGTQSPGAAHVVACLAAEPFPDGEQGSTQTPAKTDCSVSAKASYDAKKSVLTIDLTGAFAAWHAGRPPFGVALLPDPKSAQPTDAWHLTINGHKRSGTKHVQTTVVYTPGPAVDSGAAAPPAGTVSGGTTGGSVSAGGPPPVASSGSLPPPSSSAPAEVPPVVAGQQPAPQAVQPVAFARGAPPAMAFVVPVLLLAAGVFFARVFTRDATPRPLGRVVRG